MKLMILDKYKRAVSFTVLKKDAITLLGVNDTDPNFPILKEQDWLKVIELATDHSKEFSWDSIKRSLQNYYMKDMPVNNLEEQEEFLKKVNMQLEPFFKLIDYWKGKGYIPIRL